MSLILSLFLSRIVKSILQFIESRISNFAKNTLASKQIYSNVITESNLFYPFDLIIILQMIILFFKALSGMRRRNANRQPGKEISKKSNFL